VAVRPYLRHGLSYRDVEELLAERGIEVDQVTVYRWVQRFTPLLADAARFRRRSRGDRWLVDETYAKVNGVWRYVYCGHRIPRATTGSNATARVAERSDALSRAVPFRDRSPALYGSCGPRRRAASSRSCRSRPWNTSGVPGCGTRRSRPTGTSHGRKP
jgi:hypothetical protein